MPFSRPTKSSLSIFLCTVVTVACSNTHSSQTLIDEARQYQKKGDSKAAIIQLKNALQEDPNAGEARALLGGLYIEGNDARSAEKELRKAIDLGLTTERVQALLAKSLLMQGQFDKVLAQTEATTIPDMIVLRGHAYLGLEKLDQARLAFDIVHRDHPENAEALLGLAKAAMLSKNFPRAHEYVKQLLSNESQHVDGWLFMGNLLRAQTQWEAAQGAYARAVALKPGHTEALVAKAGVEISMGQYDAAKADLDAARKVGNATLPITYTQALLDFKQGKHKPALDSIQKILSAAPTHLPSLFLAGAIQYELGSTQQAEQYLKSYLERNPTDLSARKLYAAVLLKNGDRRQASALLAAAAKEAPNDTPLLLLTGESYIQAQDFAKASEYLQKARTLAPADPLIRVALSKSMSGQGDNASAIAELETAITLDENSPNASIMLLLSYLRQREYSKALALVDKLEKTKPDNAQLLYLKGNIYQAKDNREGARSNFEQAVARNDKYFPAIVALARLDVQDKKPDTARKRLESLLEKDKGNVEAMSALSSLSLAQGRIDDATYWLEQASNVNPDAVEPARQLAMHYLQIGQQQKALALAKKLYLAKTTNAETLAFLAQIQVACDDKDAALDNYEKLVKLAPSVPQHYLQLAALQASMRNDDRAMQSLQKALGLKPDYLEAKIAQAVLEMRAGRHAEAITIAKALQKQHARSSAGHDLEADVLMAQKQPALAAKSYQKALALQQNGILVSKLHQALVLAGQDKEADAVSTRWLTAHPDDLNVHRYLGSQHLRLGHYKEAIKHYESIVQHEPNNAAALNNLAWSYHQERDPRALDYAEKAHQRAPGNPAIMDTLGWILIERGVQARGLTLLQQAVALAPNASSTRYHLAVGLFKSGDKAAARRELEQALGSNTTFTDIDQARALLAQL